MSELSLTNNSAQTIWKGPEGIHAFGNFSDFSLSSDGKVAAAELSSYNSPPEVFAGHLGEWRQLTKNNARLQANWGKA
jgi:dipeptidyl aminopeptidase/acylaminoacyl peptidase